MGVGSRFVFSHPVIRAAAPYATAINFPNGVVLAVLTPAFSFAFCVVIGSVITRTHRQTGLPPELSSRVVAPVVFVSWSAIPIGSLTAGVLAQVWSPRVALVEACVAVFIGMAIIWLSPVGHLRELIDCESQRQIGSPQC
jgi:hypothetical protein